MRGPDTNAIIIIIRFDERLTRLGVRTTEVINTNLVESCTERTCTRTLRRVYTFTVFVCTRACEYQSKTFFNVYRDDI